MVYALIFWAFFVLFMKLPIWIRLPFLFVSGLQLTRLAVRRLLHAFDQEPDFSIGPDGIGGLDRTGFHVIPWNEVKSVTVHGPNIEVRGQEHGPGASSTRSRHAGSRLASASTYSRFGRLKSLMRSATSGLTSTSTKSR